MNVKNEIIDKESILSEIVLNNYFLILVIERFGIELGQQNKTIETVCSEKGISVNVFLTIINLHNSTFYYSSTIKFNNSEIKTIIEYLKNSHKYYSEEIFPEILENIHLLSEKNKMPGVSMVKSFFNQYKKEVDRHFEYENETAFPYMLNLLDNKQTNIKNYSVKKYKEHHDDIEEKLDDLKRLLIQHLPQKNDRFIRRKILFALFGLEKDLRIHTKIENDILIPFIENLEKQNTKH